MPSAARDLISSTIQRASSVSLKASYTRIGSPEPASGYATFPTTAWGTLYRPGQPASLAYPALTPYINLEMKSIVAASLAVIALVSIGGVAAAAISSVMYWQAGVPFAGGAVKGLIAGRQLAHKLAVPRLQQAFSFVGMGAAIMLAVSVLGFHV